MNTDKNRSCTMYEPVEAYASMIDIMPSKRFVRKKNKSTTKRRRASVGEEDRVKKLVVFKIEERRIPLCTIPLHYSSKAQKIKQ